MIPRALMILTIVTAVTAGMPAKAQLRSSDETRKRTEAVATVLFAPVGELDADKRLSSVAVEAVALTPAQLKGQPDVLRVYYNRFKVGNRTRAEVKTAIERLLGEFHFAYSVDAVPTNGIRPFGTPMGSPTRDTNGCLAGTLGAAATNSANKKGYITCNHVAAADVQACPNSAKADEVTLPQYPKCDPVVTIGKLTSPPPLILDPPVYNDVDAAFVEERSGGVDPTNKCQLCLSGKTADAVQGSEIRGCGAESGLMTGKVAQTSMVVRLTYIPCGAPAWFSGQIEVDGAFGKAGDSGAVVIDKDGAAVGLVFAGDQSTVTFLNPMGTVVADLGNVTITPVTIGPCK